MLDEIISYHRVIVEILFLVMAVNIILPSLLKQNIEKMVFWTRVGYFAFWMFWSMSIFAGLILFMFTHRILTLSVILMIAVSTLLALLEGYRAIRTRKLWMQGLDASRFSATILGLEILLLAAVSLYAMQAH